MTEAPEHLRVLAHTYYHQDWDAMADDPDQIVHLFTRNSGPGFAKAALAEITEVLREASSEEQLRDLWVGSLGSAFRVPATGLSFRQWFEHLADLLRSSL